MFLKINLIKMAFFFIGSIPGYDLGELPNVGTALVTKTTPESEASGGISRAHSPRKANLLRWETNQKRELKQTIQ